MVKILSIFGAILENMNFTGQAELLGSKIKGTHFLWVFKSLDFLRSTQIWKKNLPLKFDVAQ